jgi:hypothetical protein
MAGMAVDEVDSDDVQLVKAQLLQREGSTTLLFRR